MVTSTVVPETQFGSPRRVDVVGPRLLRIRAPRSAPEALEGTPGVLVQKTNHGGGSVFLRGFTGQQILILLDGVRLNNSTTRYGPNQSLNTVSGPSLARLEILHGPGSLRYGSDAIGGVVSLWSRQPRFSPDVSLGWGGAVTTRFGSADRSLIHDVAVWGQASRVAALAGGSFKRFGDLTAGDGVGRQPWTGYWEGAWDGVLAVHLGGGWFLRAGTNAMRQRDVPRTDKCSAADYRYYRVQDRDLAYLRLDGSRGRWLSRFTATLSYQSHREKRERTRFAKDRREVEWDRVHVLGASLTLHTHLHRLAHLVYGGDIYHDWVGSIAYRDAIRSGERTEMADGGFRGRFVDGSRALYGGVFLANEMRPWTWLRVRLGARLAFSHVDIPPDPLAAAYGLPERRIQTTFWGVSGGASAAATLLPGLRLVASVQQGFRAPNLDDYSHFGSEGAGFDVPSPDIDRAEKSTTLEAGVKWRSHWVSGWAMGHYSFLRDFIARVYTGETVDGEPATVRANAASGAVAGVDGLMQIHLPAGFALSGWLSWTRGDLEDPALGGAVYPLRRVPPLQGAVTASVRQGRWWGLARVRLAARQDRLSPGDLQDRRICPEGPETCRGTPGYAVVDLAAGARLHRGVHLALRVENLTDERYKTHGSGVYAPGLSAVIELRLRR